MLTIRHSPEHKPTLSVVIVTYNRCNDLKESLNALSKLEVKPYEIIVVDSNSTDCTRELVTKYPIRFINIKERSMVKARNVGWQNAKGEIVAFVDDDAQVSKTWSKYILDPFKDERVGGVVGRVISSRDEGTIIVPEKHNAIGKVLDNGFVLGNFDLEQEHIIEVDTLIGCNMSFRKNLLKEVGGFDEKFRGNCFRDDTDISLRIKQLHYKLIFHPKALVMHKYKGKTFANKWFYWTVYNYTYFFLKNFKPLSLRKFLNFFIVALRPPADYMNKTKVVIKPSFASLAYIFLGIINAFYVDRRGDPARIETIFRIA